MDVRLIVDCGNQKGRETSLSRGIYLVGRSRICQIRPKNRYVSRKHCAIIHRKHEVLIQDLGSKTGTYINRVRIDPKVAATLNDGDKIRVGKTKFRVAIVTSQGVLVNSPDSAELGQQSLDDGTQNVQVELAFAVEEDSAPHPKNDSESADSKESPQLIDDVLKMLEEDDEEDDAHSFAPGSAFRVSAKEDDIDVDDEDDSEGNVVFAAPKSGESLGIADPLPSYASRKDWDVKSVYSWIDQKETFARLDERRAKRRAKDRIQNSEGNQGEVEEGTAEAIPSAESYTPQQREVQARVATSKAKLETQRQPLSAWLNSDAVRPVVLVGVAVAFVAWIIWNAWLLISFKG